jgi:signal transduction histidine kinase
MKNYFKPLVDLGTLKFNGEEKNQRIRFGNTIALIHLFFIIFILLLLIYQYGFRLGAQLVLLSSLIPFITFFLNYWRQHAIARYWVSVIIPVTIMAISVVTKINNPIGFTGFYEFFDTRMLLLVSAIIPLIVFPRRPLFKIMAGLLPSALLLVFYDPIHGFFNVGYTDLFDDPKEGYYIAGVLFDVSYMFAIIGILSLKSLNEKLIESNSILIDDLHTKNAIQEKTLLRKQELLVQNREASESLLKKQKEILISKKELEQASELIIRQKSELEFKNIELNSKVEERTRELKNANKELITQNNGLLQFSNTVSHNLRAPVASLLGLIHLFEIEKDETRKEEMLSHIKSSSLALDTIISDLNKVVDIRNRLFHLKENIIIEEEVEKILLLLRAGIDEIGASIETLFEQPDIYFIRSYLHSILFNLINNAIKYSKPQSKNIIQIKSWKRSNSICIEVKDTGLGIDLVKFSNNLFKMHKRFHDHVDGKGMGLYLVKQQVEAMNGKIAVESEPENGTKFLMEFPIPEEVHFQEYYKSSLATIAYDANLTTSVLIWHQPPDTKEYMDVLNANKEMFANYAAVNWLIDIRNLGLIAEENRTWFSSEVLPVILERGCKTIVVVKDETDGKDFAYWQNMIEVSNKMGVIFNMLFDYDLAIEYLQEKELSPQE